MPCHDSSDDEDAKFNKKRLDLTTALLCEVCTEFERTGQLGGMSAQLRDWWAEHKAADLKKELWPWIK